VLGVEAGAGALAPSPLARQLELLNGERVAGRLARGEHAVDAIADFAATPREGLDELFLATLSRRPREDELAVLLPRLDPAAPRAPLRTVAHAVLLSREFGSIR
jgi:hypothetical protein